MSSGCRAKNDRVAPAMRQVLVASIQSSHFASPANSQILLVFQRPCQKTRIVLARSYWVRPSPGCDKPCKSVPDESRSVDSLRHICLARDTQRPSRPSAHPGWQPITGAYSPHPRMYRPNPIRMLPESESPPQTSVAQEYASIANLKIITTMKYKAISGPAPHHLDFLQILEFMHFR